MADSQTIQDKKKSHRDRHSGRKAEKKKAKKDAQNRVLEQTDKQRNPKAFAFNSAVRAERRFRRKQDIDTKKQHVPLVDRQAIEPPPILIAVVGPPKVGKTTVINNLIRLFTRSPLTDLKGPVTIVTGKKRRITLIKCNNDINSMIDLAKVADLVLLLCDASFGFEMEIFEFLNICQVHGMPRIMGVLTHLDMIKNQKTLKNTKKTLKHRFWTEVYPGAKLFYLSGIIHGEYLRNEIKNLGRFISVMKFRPLTWRTTHSYLLGDRYEDLTSQEFIRKNPKCDRNISLYGYIRGVPLNKNSMIHIAGFGDVRINDIAFLPDPCPLPEQMKKRALIEKEKLIYAPFSGVGGIVYDKDAVYVELGGSHSHNKRNEEDETTNLMTNLIDAKETLDIKMEHSKMKIFTEGKEITAEDVGKEDSSENEYENDSGNEEDKPQVQQPVLYSKPQEKEEDELDKELHELRKNQHKEEIITDDTGRTRRKVIFDVPDDVFAEGVSDNSESEEDDEELSDIDEDSDDEDEQKLKTGKKIENKANTNELPSPYTNLKENKDKDVFHKINDVLKQLDEKKFSQADWENSDEDDNDESDLIETFSQNKTKKSIERESDSEGISDSSEDDSSNNEGNVITSKKQKNQESCNKKKKDDDNEDTDIDEEDDFSEDDIDEDKNPDLKWKDNLATKAEEAFLERQKSTKNLMKLVYGVFDAKHLTKLENTEDSEEDDQEEIGGLFKLATREQEKKKMEKDKMDLEESTLNMPWNANIRNWLENENKILIQNCFVTGKWKESEDASELLRLDDAEDLSDVGSECFGDFEDLETGEKFSTQNSGGTNEKRKRDDNEKDILADREALAEKKRKLKEKFDAEYDNQEKASFYEDLKTNAEKQAQLNKSVFDNMPDDLRVQIEGYRAGMYVRIEIENVPCEFITNFNPTYPIIIGALNMGEENIGFVNVKIKKHRWYKKILKANDPLIISLGWRRFQTLPLYSKLEDDMKCRYLKYTPEHLTCNAHFWGPITPQGTGFLALQSCDGNLEALKKQGFRIAATGAVQELDKSTQIMKKLKLIGHPMKIYKKTAFIKGMFNSALEVAKFEGARIKTVSGIRGQIKKAASKPEGVFRATFEDKILLSDIVFCRTWYKVDVQKFYNPVTTLLLPEDLKNSWRGLRTTGEIKREKGLRSQVDKDSLYTEIKREPKVFKPLAIPSKLQQALPYRDKPKHEVRNKDKKKQIERVAVIREPKEQKVANMLKMIKTAYDHKQDQLKQQTKERLEKHRKAIEDIELKKNKKLRDVKKNVFRQRSKAQLAQERKGNKGGGSKGSRDELD